MRRIEQAQQAELAAQQVRHELELDRTRFEYERRLAQRDAEARQEATTHALVAGGAAAATVLAATNVLAVQAPEDRRTAQALLSLGGSSALALGAVAEKGSVARTFCFALGISAIGVSIYDFFHQRISGPPGGIGATLRQQGNALVIHWIRPNTAAAAVGLSAGDEIVGVDGLTVAQIGVDDACRRLRGPVGTQVHVAVRRTTTTNTYEWSVTMIRTPT
mgnify:FL=1